MSCITLNSRHMQCDLRPDLGGCIAGLWHHGVPVLRSTPGAALQSVRHSASYPLVPYSNRQAFARMQWQGRAHALVPNFAPEPHAIHGTGWEQPWDVADQQTDRVTLSMAHRPDARWPFAFTATQTIALQDDGLSLHLAMTNTAAQDAPAGLGWHPYFAKHGDDTLTFASQGRWDMDADKLPTACLPHTGLNQDCAALTVDHCFSGWSGTLALHNACFGVELTSDLRHVVVFTAPTRDSIAIEPVSHANNALNLLAAGRASADALGVCVLPSGQTMAAHMRIRVQPR